MNRREMLQRSGLTVVGARFAYLAAVSGVAESCSASSVFTNILNWIPVGEAAVNSILSVLTANGIIIAAPIQAIVSLVEAGFAALEAAVKEYQATTPPPVGALAKIEAALKDVVDNFSTFLSSLNISGGLVSIIAGIAQIILSTIAAFMNQLPAASSLKRTVVIGTAYKVGASSVSIVPKERTRGQFKRDVNAVLTGAPSVGVICPASAYLKLTFWEKF